MLRHHQPLSAIAGPLSLVLLPKCPLCFASILAGAGVIVPGALGLRLAAGLIAAAWLAVLFVMTRGRTFLRVTVALAAVISFAGIAAQVRPLLWIGVAAMAAAGIASTRSCAMKRTVSAPSIATF